MHLQLMSNLTRDFWPCHLLTAWISAVYLLHIAVFSHVKQNTIFVTNFVKSIVSDISKSQDHYIKVCMCRFFKM